MASPTDDDRCPDCGFLACICFRDDDEPEEHDPMDDCGKMPGGGCMLAGTEFCDFECPLRG